MTTTTSPIPTAIRFRPVESDDFLDDFAASHRWTPFEAACLIRGYEPSQVTETPAIVGVVSAAALDNYALGEFDHENPEAAKDLLRIALTIGQKWEDEFPTGESVVDWAIGKGLMWDTPFTRKVLGRVPAAAHLAEVERLNGAIESLEKRLAHETDGRGAHHEEKRVAILGVAIRELAKNLGDQPDKIHGLFRGERVSASGLATHMDQYRDDVGLPSGDERGFSHGNMEDVLREALGAATKLSTDKK